MVISHISKTETFNYYSKPNKHNKLKRVKYETDKTGIIYLKIY